MSLNKRGKRQTKALPRKSQPARTKRRRKYQKRKSESTNRLTKASLTSGTKRIKRRKRRLNKTMRTKATLMLKDKMMVTLMTLISMQRRSLKAKMRNSILRNIWLGEKSRTPKEAKLKKMKKLS